MQRLKSVFDAHKKGEEVFLWVTPEKQTSIKTPNITVNLFHTLKSCTGTVMKLNNNMSTCEKWAMCYKMNNSNCKIWHQKVLMTWVHLFILWHIESVAQYWRLNCRHESPVGPVWDSGSTPSESETRFKAEPVSRFKFWFSATVVELPLGLRCFKNHCNYVNNGKL